MAIDFFFLSSNISINDLTLFKRHSDAEKLSVVSPPFIKVCLVVVCLYEIRQYKTLPVGEGRCLCTVQTAFESI